MIFTDSAKDFLTDILKQQNKDAFSFNTKVMENGHKVLEMDLAVQAENTDKEAMMINGIAVYMDEETAGWTEQITIDSRNGGLSMRNANDPGCGGSCGSCGGCH